MTALAEIPHTQGSSRRRASPEADWLHQLHSIGGTEALATILALHHGQLPANAGVTQIDPALNLDVILNSPREAAPQLALSNSLAFGGLNAVLALRPFTNRV